MLLISTHLYFATSAKWADGREDYFAEMLALQQAILFHDVAEGRRGTSDVSAWAKRRSPHIKESISWAEAQIAVDFGFDGWINPYSNRNERRVKMCDKLELMWTVISQLQLGNTIIFDASWPVIIEMMEEMKSDMEMNELKLYKEWRDRANQIRG